MDNKLSLPEILIVDDDRGNIKFLGTELKEHYRVRFATNGEKALEIANSDPSPDLILLDVVMPAMDGYAVCKKLKENEKTKNIPVIFITGKDEIEDETKGFELGAVDYIIKPLRLSIVKARINIHLNLKLKSDHLEKQAFLDDLTKIAGRRKFDDFYQQEWNRALRSQTVISVIMIGVDFFKSYNDNYGQSAGDECLARVAHSLVDALTRNTDLVARYGEDKFIAVLPETDIELAEEIAEKMRLNIDNLDIFDSSSQVSQKITISVGAVATVPSRSAIASELIDAAVETFDKAQYLGRNRVECTVLK